MVRKKHLLLLLLMAIFLGLRNTAFAGTGGVEFTEIYQTLLDWTQGTLGKVLALGTFLVGMGIGIVRQSLMPIALGIGAGMAVYYTPNIVDAIVTAMI